MKNHITLRVARYRHYVRAFCPTGDKAGEASQPASEDSDAPVNKPVPEAITAVPSSPSWITARAATGSNTLAESVYKSFTSSSLLRVLMHTTQPMFNGKMKHLRTLNRIL